MRTENPRVGSARPSFANNVAGAKLIEFSINPMLRGLLLKKLPIVFTAPEIWQFIAQGTAHRYSTNR